MAGVTTHLTVMGEVNCPGKGCLECRDIEQCKAAQRSKVEDILTDRWSLDQEDDWDEFGPDTLDDIMEVFYGQR